MRRWKWWPTRGIRRFVPHLERLREAAAAAEVLDDGLDLGLRDMAFLGEAPLLQDGGQREARVRGGRDPAEEGVLLAPRRRRRGRGSLLGGHGARGRRFPRRWRRWRRGDGFLDRHAAEEAAAAEEDTTDVLQRRGGVWAGGGGGGGGGGGAASALRRSRVKGFGRGEGKEIEEMGNKFTVRPST
ncbi:hypothetical protein DAI22_10g148700 [Oryza sativa Japonica Group]|nr:hypothetical protein DAI22_10g148700 [Oryza sativa Japonica Group]